MTYKIPEQEEAGREKERKMGGVLLTPQGVMSVVEPEEDMWPQVRERVTKYCSEHNLPELKHYTRFRKTQILRLALALAKYDYYGAPSNWDLKYEREETIYRWTKWCMKHQMENYDMLTGMYDQGLIPSASSEMTNYFT